MTAQSFDRIEYEGLDVYFRGPSMPVNHPRICNDGQDFPMPTSMWRGYEARWALRQDTLYLLSVWGRWSMLGDEPIPANWVHGDIAIPQGDFLGEEIWGPVHERTLYLRFSAGRLLTKWEELNAPPPPFQDLSLDE